MKKYEKEVQKAFLDDEEAVIRKLTNLSLPDIGKEFGRDHTTALHSIKKIELALKGENPSLQNNLRDITANINSSL